MLRIALIFYSIKQATNIEARKIRILRSPYYTRTMAPQMEISTIMSHVHDFGVGYVGKKHADHLVTILKKYHNITEYWEGKKYAGIDLKWDYNK